MLRSAVKDIFLKSKFWQFAIGKAIIEEENQTFRNIFRHSIAWNTLVLKMQLS